MFSKLVFARPGRLGKTITRHAKAVPGQRRLLDFSYSGLSISNLELHSFLSEHLFFETNEKERNGLAIGRDMRNFISSTVHIQQVRVYDLIK